MGKIWMPGGGGSADLDVVTAAAADVLSGKVIVDAEGNPVTGTMPNKTGTALTVATNGKTLIPKGYHDGTKYATNTQATMAGKTITPSSSAQTVACNGKLMTGNIVVSAIPSGWYQISGSAVVFDKGVGYYGNSLASKLYISTNISTPVNISTPYFVDEYYEDEDGNEEWSCGNLLTQNHFMMLSKPINLKGISKIGVRAGNTYGSAFTVVCKIVREDKSGAVALPDVSFGFREQYETWKEFDVSSYDGFYGIGFTTRSSNNYLTSIRVTP